MLCLGRRVGECIHLGNDIVIRILSVKGQQIRVGIEAPDDVPIKRGEIHGEIVVVDSENLSESA